MYVFFIGMGNWVCKIKWRKKSYVTRYKLCGRKYLDLGFKMVLLFGRPPVCAVWTNSEVVVFQPWSSTAPNLGSVANFTSKLNPAPPLSTFFWVFRFPSPSVSLRPPILHLLDDLHRSCAPYYHHYIIFLDCLSTQNGDVVVYVDTVNQLIRFVLIMRWWGSKIGDWPL